MRRTRIRKLAAILGIGALVALAASTPTEIRQASAVDPTLIAAGDIASSSADDEATATLLDDIPGTVVTLGDNVYPDGTPAEFTSYYDPTWGRHKAATMPSPGNHDYHTAGASGYFGYFGAAAGDPAKGYYSFDIGAWHIISLNSNCASIGGCQAGSAQESWLRLDLATHQSAACTLAYFHHPRFNAGLHGNNTNITPIWQALHDYGADVILAGHDHNYQRFAPMTAAGTLDTTFGIQQFIVGTGGRSHYAVNEAFPNLLASNEDTYGVLVMTLHASSYDWDFVPVAGGTYDDTGTANCHAAPLPDSDSDGWIDISDNCPVDANNGQENNDRNFIDLPPTEAFDDLTRARSDTAGDACDMDDDNDGLDDAVETGGPPCASATLPTNPVADDSDGDRALDGIECTLGTNPNNSGNAPTNAACGTNADTDGDGIINFRETCYFNTSTSSANTDGDACADGKEVASINSDTQVNVIDLQQVAQSAGPSSDPDYIADFDITRNGSIDVIDLQQTAQQTGAC